MNEYDELLKQITGNNPYEQLLEDEDKQSRSRMAITAREASNLNPDKSAEIINLSNQFKVPPDFVERNYDEFKKSKDVRVIQDFYDLALKHPAIQEWFSDKHNLSASKDDLSNLGLLNWIIEAPVRAKQIGDAQVEFGHLRYRSIYGQLTAEEYRRLDELRRLMSVDLAAESIPAQMLTGAAQQLPMLLGSLKAGFMTGAPTAMMAGTVASIMGQLGPQAVLPEEVITVPAATLAGYIAGQTTGAARFSFEQEAGHAYEEFSKFIDENGQPLDPATARVAALVAGAINSGLDVAQLGILLRSIPGAEKLASIPGRLIVKKALEKQTVRSALTEFAKNYSKVLTAESAIEVAQRAVTIMAGEIAKISSDQEIQARSPEDILTDLAQEGAHALMGFSLIVAPGPLIKAGIDLREAHNAKVRENFFLALGTTMEESKLRERMPEQTAALISKLTENGPIESVYIEPEVIQKYFQEKNIDPRAAMREVMGSSDAYDQALAAGHMLQIPISDYAVNLAPTEHNAFFARELRFSPEELNQREIEEIVRESESQQEIEKEQEAEQQTAADVVRDMLESVGYDRKTAETMAAQMGAFFETMAKRVGKQSGLDLLKKYALNIVRRVSGEQQPQMELDQIVYHGSPFEFDRFDVSKIGTGQGSYVHGWGLYFARDKSTAHRYKAELGRTAIRIKGATQSDVDSLEDRNWVNAYKEAKTQDKRRELANDYMQRTKIEYNTALSILETQKKLNNEVAVKNAKYKLSRLSQRLYLLERMLNEDLKIEGGGRLYTVDIKVDDSELLDLDAVLPESPTGPLANVLENPAVTEAMYDYTPVSENPTGRSLYRAIVRAAEEGDNRIWDVVGSPRKTERMTPEEVASRFLLAYGIKGLSYVGRQDGPAVVIFDDSLVDIVSYEQRSAKAQHIENQEVRGRMLKFGEYEYSIELFENADLSTFLHESGHFYLEVLKFLAKESPQVKADLDTLLKWFGVESVDQIQREHHEKFAKGLEAYFMEGKAPSVSLRAVFARFRSWLIGIYHRLQELGVRLNDDVRAVMDRMFATEQEIEAARREAQVQPIFLNAEMAGMRPEEFERYKKLVEDANRTAREELELRLMKQYRREHEEWWNEQRNIVREEVFKEFYENRDVIAYSVLRYGKMPDGSDLPEGFNPIKLDRDSVIKAYGSADPKTLNTSERLRRLGVYRTKDGVPLSVAAELLGYTSGDELVKGILAAADWRDRVEIETDARMKARYGDALSDGTLHEMAVQAVNNEKRSELLHAELKALVKKRNEVAPFVQEERNRQKAEQSLGLATVRGVPSLSVFQRLAKARINAMQIRNIKPNTYLVAARQAAVEAVDAAIKGDYQTAAAAKQRELFNMELYRVAINATEEIDQALDYIRSLSTPAARKRFGLAGDIYLQQIADLLQRFDFSPMPLVEIEKRIRLAEFIDRMEREGEPVDIDPRLVNEAFRKPYRAMTFEEFIGVRDAFKNIDHLARLKNRLLKAKHKRELGEVLNQIETTIRENAPTESRDLLKERLPQSEVARFVGNFFASHRKLASLVRQLDGFKDNGPVWEHIMLPLNEASNHEASMIHEVGKKLAQLFAQYTHASDIARNTITRLSLGLIESGMYKREYIPAIDTSLSKMQRLMVALNMGNEDNKIKLMEGYGWNEDQLTAIVDPLTKEDWDFVQGVWDFINSYWPQIEAKQKRVTGVAPEKVQATPVITKHGVYAGGYFPLKYDDRISPQAYAHRAEEAAKITMHGAYARATTKRGHTIERVQGVKMPVRLDFGVIFEHMHNVIHDLAFHEALIDVNRILGNRQIQRTIIETYGDHVYKAMRDAVTDTAAGEISAITAFEKSVNWLRHGVSIAAMGWNLMTGLLQPLGISQSIVRIGPQWVFRGISRWLSDSVRAENTVKWIHSKSELMRNRYFTLNREINDIRNRLYGGAGASSITDTYFWLITRLQLVADVPTWLGAYERFMEEIGDEARAIALADQAVLDSQGGGQIKDLADIQRHGPLMRLWTNFYSYFNVTYNLTAESIRKTKITDPVSIVNLAWDLLFLYTVPAVLGFMIKEGLRGGEEYDDDELIKKLMAEQASYILGTMVGFREFSGVVQGFYGYEGPAGTRFYSEGANLIKQVAQGETDEALWKALNNTAGIVLHYPAGQAQRTIEGYMAISEGKGTVINIFSGKPRE